MSNYPEEIYKATNESGKEWAERIYKTGFKFGHSIGRDQAKNEFLLATKPHEKTEWYNLTEQIQAGANIDWEQLDGVPAKCVHESGAVYQHKLVRNKEHYLAPVTMLEDYCPVGWGGAFVNAWHGDDGWTLFIDRPVPLKRKTADQLELGVEFIGQPRCKPGQTGYCYTVPSGGERKVITAEGVLFDPEWVEVVDDEA